MTDTLLPEGERTWAFDDAVTAVFEDMLQRSIPQYDVMRQAVFDMASRFVQPGTAVVDLGCSRGEALAPLVDKFGSHNRFIGIEVSPPMLAACRERFAGLIRCGVVDIRDLDLRHDFPPVQASVMLCVLTLQFIPLEYRQRLVRRMYEHLVPGGALLLVEKVLGATAGINDVMVETYLGLKADHGYSPEQIERKRLALEGVLVPVTARWNEELLAMAGFTQRDVIWRWMNFAAWLAVKDS
jgi:tRNA (cmo5U34)-methyltransferase